MWPLLVAHAFLALGAPNSACYTIAMKLMISIGIFVVGGLGGYLGSLIDNGNNLIGPWSLGLSTLGSFAGIWVGYKASQYFDF